MSNLMGAAIFGRTLDGSVSSAVLVLIVVEIVLAAAALLAFILLTVHKNTLAQKKQDILAAFDVKPAPERKLVGIGVDASAAQTKFTVGERFVADGVIVTAHFDAEPYEERVYDFTVDPPEMNEAGEKQAAVRYGEVVEYYTVVVEEAAPVEEVAEEAAPAEEAKEEPVQEEAKEEAAPVEEAKEEPVQEETAEEAAPVEEAKEEPVQEEAAEEAAPVEEAKEEPVQEEVAEEAAPAEEVKEEPVQEETKEEVIQETTEEPVQEEKIEEAVQETIEETAPVEEAEETAAEGAEIELAAGLAGDRDGTMRYDRSFTARIIQSDDDTKRRYSMLKNELLSYLGAKSRMSWRKESFRCGQTLVARLGFRGKILCLYLPLDPAGFAETRYKVEDASSNKADEDAPCLFRIRNEKRARLGCELIAMVMDALGVERTDAPAGDYAVPYRETEELIAQGLIRMTTTVAPPQRVFAQEKK